MWYGELEKSLDLTPQKKICSILCSLVDSSLPYRKQIFMLVLVGWMLWNNVSRSYSSVPFLLESFSGVVTDEKPLHQSKKPRFWRSCKCKIYQTCDSNFLIAMKLRSSKAMNFPLLIWTLLLLIFLYLPQLVYMDFGVPSLVNPLYHWWNLVQL